MLRDKIKYQQSKVFEGRCFSATSKYFGKVITAKPVVADLEKKNSFLEKCKNLQDFLYKNLSNRANLVRNTPNTPFKTISNKKNSILSKLNSYISKNALWRLIMNNYPFYKMQALGNDYIYFDCINNKEILNPSEVAIKVSNRHFSIGSDGIILICTSTVADVKMRMFNADGSEGLMCGNGIRCVAKYVYDNNIVLKREFTIETLSGVKQVYILDDNNIKVDMGKAKIMTIDDNKILDYPLNVDDREYKINCISMGNPHCVVYEDEIDKLDLEKIGPKFENNNMFSNKINTEFVKVENNEEISMRVYERGSGETYACGSGACAAVAMSCIKGLCRKNKDILVHLKGGDLLVKFLDDAKVFMTGSATMVYKGEINL